MLYKENDVPPREMARHKYQSEPFQSPTHAGGLFAMDRKFFLKLGGYDPGLLVWGGENFGKFPFFFISIFVICSIN
jgi:polypeptide N-acetylgalactosaminyltransferase